ncbi:LuxR family transcriptional regulator [Micromonospora sp. KC606]|uniref:helix-turn-helix domain-containing protein n=1 Tax=Micromonospora sp. KC606 TaxID=2530379 RepID=UPI00104A61C5|nr:helix-turn-helix transcriptional regulator [Micromonospora sp. KC606]TDC85790.1 LuxR family transcriptional regulator [Micromonospora sp. KC606]
MGAAQNEWDLIETSIQTLPGLDVLHEAALSAARGVLGDEAFNQALVHRGPGNRETAEALVISPRTVETHVQNVLSKLGFTSRRQLAVWIGEQASGTGDL